MAITDPLREQVVDAAIRVLLKGGSQALNTAAIAREAGLKQSTPVLQQLGIDGIVDGIVGRVAHTWESAVDRALIGVDLTGDQWIEPLLGAVFDAANANRHVTDALPGRSTAMLDYVGTRLSRVLDGLGSRRSAFLMNGLRGALDREIHAPRPNRDAFIADVGPLVKACLDGGRTWANGN